MFAAHKETRRQSQKQNEATTLTLLINDVEEVLALGGTCSNSHTQGLWRPAASRAI